MIFRKENNSHYFIHGYILTPEKEKGDYHAPPRRKTYLLAK